MSRNAMLSFVFIVCLLALSSPASALAPAVLGAACTTLGATQMSSDSTSILACLKETATSTSYAWQSMTDSVSSSCIRKRSGIHTKDTVTWCPSDHPNLYSCIQVDDQAATTITDLTSACPNDGTCLMKTGVLERTNLGTNGIYYERVKKTVGSSTIEGCVMYDYEHDHLPHRSDIMCCS